MGDEHVTARVLQIVESVVAIREYHFSPQRIAAVVPEVQRLQGLVERLRALPIDNEVPAVQFVHR